MSTNDPLAVLQRIRSSSSAAAPRPGERCDLCGETVPDEHGHLVDLDARGLLCGCRACYLLFTPDGAGGRRYRAVPDRYLSFPEFRLSPERWDALQIPVGVAFFFMNSTLERVAAFYPSPAGATESMLSLDTWSDVVLENPSLATLMPDVEALLVRVPRASTDIECFLVPIDACYELVGRLRMLWRGFDGGAEAREALDSFFATVRARARPVPEATS